MNLTRIKTIKGHLYFGRSEQRTDCHVVIDNYLQDGKERFTTPLAPDMKFVELSHCLNFLKRNGY